MTFMCVSIMLSVLVTGKIGHTVVIRMVGSAGWGRVNTNIVKM